MKATRWWGLVAVALASAGLVLTQAEAGKPSDADAELRALRQQVETLQQRLKTLEDRLAKVESPRPPDAPRFRLLPKSPGSPPAITVPAPLDLLGQPVPRPKVSGQREVNGWTFYFVPCGDE